jgi:lipopolysaccharide transport system ATP-binding protein
MSDVVIHAEGLGKKYLIGHQSSSERYLSLRDVVTRRAKELLRSTQDVARGRQLVDGGEAVEFWALKDVSFEIKRGDIVGIIGRNGAGKSTLLKILSRITEPTEGRVTISGRVASLLEVGTGFHPELTGRENILLNGSILGMFRREIHQKFDEIVDFAGVEKFIDTPVKRYSSGMYVRLAFAVAAHLNPDILLVDEVLAVGDLQFQEKCLSKMDEVSRGGRTIIFVSHNLAALSNLCSRALLLESGHVTADGSTKNCISQYISNSAKIFVRNDFKRVPGNGQKLFIKSVKITNGDKVSEGVIDNSLPTFVEIAVDVLKPGTSYAVAYELRTQSGEVIFSSSSLDLRPAMDLGSFHSMGEYLAKARLPVNWLLTGSYAITVTATIPAVEVLDVFPADLCFNIQDSSSPVATLGEGRRGLVAPRLDWEISQYTD